MNERPQNSGGKLRLAVNMKGRGIFYHLVTNRQTSHHNRYLHFPEGNLHHILSLHKKTVPLYPRPNRLRPKRLSGSRQTQKLLIVEIVNDIMSFMIISIKTSLCAGACRSFSTLLRKPQGTKFSYLRMILFSQKAGQVFERAPLS